MNTAQELFEHLRAARPATPGKLPAATLPTLAAQIAATYHWSERECADRSGIAKTTWRRVVRGQGELSEAVMGKLVGFVERYG